VDGVATKLLNVVKMESERQCPFIAGAFGKFGSANSARQIPRKSCRLFGAAGSPFM
jgi:hypothetical protein